jgi:hypothetical protein
MSVCVHYVFILFCVQVTTLQRADPLSKESYRLCIELRNWKRGKYSKGYRAIDRLFTVYKIKHLLSNKGARGSVVGRGTMLQAGRSPVRIPDEVVFFNLPNPSSRTMSLGSTQPLTEMSTRKLPGGKKRLGLTTLPPSMSPMSENVGAWTSRNPKGLHGLYGNNFT